MKGRMGPGAASVAGRGARKTTAATVRKPSQAEAAQPAAPLSVPISYEAEPGPEDNEIDHGILHEFVGMYLRTAYEAAYADFTDRLGEEALRPGYFTILTLIVRNPRISQTQIGAASARDKSTVTNALRWMEDAGLITRLKSAHDRRAQLSVATPEGIALQQRMEEKAADHLAALNAAIGAEEYASFLATLKRMTRRLAEGQAETD